MFRDGPPHIVITNPDILHHQVGSPMSPLFFFDKHWFLSFRFVDFVLDTAPPRT